jgi:putative membrane protein
MSPFSTGAFMSRRLSLALSMVLAVAACHHAPEPAPGVPQLTDGNIVAIVLAANYTDLNYAALAPSRARSDAVKTFAQRMTTDHTILNNRVREIAQKNGIVAEDHEISLDFRDRSATRRDILRELDGFRFDSTYAANEVQYHTELLAALNGALIPAAQNAELKEFVTQLRPAVNAHLQHAQQMMATINARK